MIKFDLTESVESLVSQVTDEFMQRLDRGEQPKIEEYAARYPQIATVLQEVLPALQALRSPSEELGLEGGLPACEALTAGRLGDYRILREVGRGGMGVVYEAEQISLARRVALKVLPFAATLDAKQLQRFKNEAQAAAHLHHQNIVPVYAVGCERGVHYYAMQFIDGQSLAALIGELRGLVGLSVADQRVAPTKDLREARAAPADEPTIPGTPALPGAAAATRSISAISTERSIQTAAHWRTVANLGVQTAKALDHAHSLGVVHRDIKPANLLVDVRGTLWITDFGLAHSQSQAGLTMTGDLVGTMRYMSPEQALAQRGIIDHRTDLYSLGATLYELLTLEPALGGCDRQELLRQIALEEPRSPQLLNKCIPVDLETIVLKAMAKNPADRYATAQELAEDLERLLRDEPIRAKRPTWWQRLRKWARRHQPVMWSAAVCLLLAVAMFTGSIGWIVRDRAERLAVTEREVKLALGEATGLQMRGRWPEALEAAKRAEGLLAAGGSEELGPRVRALRKDLEMVIRLEEIRLPPVDAVMEDGPDPAVLDAEYDQAFKDYGIDVKRLEPAEAAQRVRTRAIRIELIAALDDWAKRKSIRRTSEAENAIRERLIVVAGAADPDEWRNQVRDASLHHQNQTLRELAASPKIKNLPRQTLSLLGWALDSAGAGEQAVAVLRQALQKYPDDYEMNFQLGWSLDHGSCGTLEDVVRFYSIARSLRPRNIRVQLILAGKLFEQGKLEEAIAVYGAARELKPDVWQIYQGLGAAFRQQDKLDEAVVEFHQALALKGDTAAPHLSLGLVCERLDQLDEAMVEWRKAVALEPRLPLANFFLASALREKGEYVEALTYAQRCRRLGSGQRDWPYPPLELISTLEKLAKLAPRLGRVLDGKETVANAEEQAACAELCYHQRKFDRAASLYEEGLAREPRLAQSLTAGHRRRAACCAALAGMGEGHDASSLAEGRRTRRRRQARNWLRADLEQQARALEKASPAARSAILQNLRHWLSNRDLKSLRDEDWLAKLPTPERNDCAVLWNDVRELLRKVMISP